MTMKTFMQWLSVILLAGVMTGCASTAEMSEVRMMAEQAMAMSKQAATQAESADMHAGEAMKAAQEAQTCCMKNSEKIDRAFERAMQK